MAKRYWRWRAYTFEILKRLGYEGEKSEGKRAMRDKRIITAYIVRRLRDDGFDFASAERKLASHEFRKSGEKRQMMDILRDVLYLERGEGEYKPQARMVKLNENDPSMKDMHADPALLFFREAEADEITAALDALNKRDKKMLELKVWYGLSYREVASRMHISVGYVHKRIRVIQVMLAQQLSKSGSKNRD